MDDRSGHKSSIQKSEYAENDHFSPNFAQFSENKSHSKNLKIDLNVNSLKKMKIGNGHESKSRNSRLTPSNKENTNIVFNRVDQSPLGRNMARKFSKKQLEIHNDSNHSRSHLHNLKGISK
jgi:hypothetical protein